MNFEEQLIEEVRQNECLYIKSLESYKDIVLHGKVWHEISLRLGVSSAACKRRWASLMDTYQRNKRRLRPGIAKPVKIRWKYFKQLAELDNLASTRVVPSNIDYSVDALVPEGFIEEHTSLILDGVSQSIEELRSVLEERRAQTSTSTAQFMIALSNRIDRSGLFENEVAELKMEATNFVSSEIMKIQNNRV